MNPLIRRATLAGLFAIAIAIAGALAACGGSGLPLPASGPAPTASSPARPASRFTLTPTAIKSFHFAWDDAADETGYRLLEDPDGASGYSLIAELPAGTTQYDHGVFLPARVNARYLLQVCKGIDCVDAATVDANGPLVSAIGYFKASNPADADLFGASLALSTNGRYLAVGAPSYAASNSNSGSVYVFVRQGATWQQQAMLEASVPQPGDGFGASLALSGEGDTLVIGAPGDGGAVPAGGAVYVFARTGDGWNLQQRVNASAPDLGDRFGEWVALSSDGETLAVSAPNESGDANTINGPDNNTLRGSGAAYVFTRAGGAWTQQAYVKASHPDAFDNFGRALALSADGQTLAVGAPLEASAAKGVGGDPQDNTLYASGAVYVFGRSRDGWSQQAYVKASTPQQSAWFGSAIALSADGRVMAVGSRYESSDATGIDGNQDNTAAYQSGAAYVFVRQGTQWGQTAYVKASNTGARDLFGISVALSGDGNTLAVGAVGEDGDTDGLQGEQDDDNASSSGAVYLFQHTGTGWRQQAYVKASNTRSGGVFNLGSALALSGRTDGAMDQAPTLAVGCSYASNNSRGVGGDQNNAAGSDVGAVYLY